MNDEIRTALVVGSGLVGTSVALALTQRGYTVLLHDIDDARLRDAAALCACRPWGRTEAVHVAVVAVPPAQTCAAVCDILRSSPAAVVTDTASVKVGVQQAIEQELASTGEPAALERYHGGHPIAGGELSGPAGARGDLFVGRPWVLTPGRASVEAQRVVGQLVADCGAVPVLMDAEHHDAAVALTSHVPQLLASALASLFAEADDETLRLAGAGLRDMTRIAASDATMWSQIAADNAANVARTLDAILQRLTSLSAALHAAEPQEAVETLLRAGNVGQRRIEDGVP
ncbi:MAG: prephenate dehydrogenase/arogenate dehydrogenase family protein [Candidatus Dormibacteraeota bacterium]|nr:prephenate dehydrogenase/arogenate dehydrogenase family protein [Candidatus Dormibacteraeota bacterium]